MFSARGALAPQRRESTSLRDRLISLGLIVPHPEWADAIRASKDPGSPCWAPPFPGPCLRLRGDEGRALNMQPVLDPEGYAADTVERRLRLAS